MHNDIHRLEDYNDIHRLEDYNDIHRLEDYNYDIYDGHLDCDDVWHLA